MNIRTSKLNDLQTLNEIEIKPDITLNLNNFNKLSYIHDRECLARMIQNIIVTKKGRYPNNVDFGVGIEDYMFELADANTLSSLLASINDQISKWIVKDEDIEIQIDGNFIKSSSNRYVNLVLYFTITRDPSLNVINKDDYDVFTLLLTNDLKNRKIISKLEL